MLSLISLFVTLGVSLLIVRIATLALTHTGLSRQSARFQARSAFTGVGFTTDEAERMVNHPVRRRIVMILMLLGNVGIVTVITSAILTFVQPERTDAWWLRLALLLGGITLLWLAAASQWVDTYLSRLINWALRHYTDLDVRDYAGLLHVSEEYSVVELEVREEGWLTTGTLADMKLADEGVLVLGIYRQGGNYVGAPTGENELAEGDTLVVYGPSSRISELDERRAGRSGDEAHEGAVAEHEERRAEQRREDERQNRSGADEERETTRAT